MLHLYVSISLYMGFYCLGLMHGDETGEFDGYAWWKVYTAALALGFAWPGFIGWFVYRKAIKVFKVLKARYGPR